MVKVLIVDDNIALTAFIKSMLESEKMCQVETAGNGEAGYLAFLNFNPDIVVTDIEMPLKNGFEMMRNIRTHQAEIKTIYMSGNLDRHRRFLEVERKNHGVDLIDKPFVFSKLKGLVKKLQERKGG